MKKLESVPTDVMDVLRTTDVTLGEVIESTLGVAPTLDVVGQWRLEPPHPAWVSPPLPEETDVLGRCTGYRMGLEQLSHNIAYVDLGRIEPAIAAKLEAQEIHLGQLFLNDQIEKFGFEFGTHDVAGGLDAELSQRLDGVATDLRPYVWRRYFAAVGGAVAFVVIEALPCGTWGRIFGSGNGHVGASGEAT